MKLHHPRRPSVIAAALFVAVALAMTQCVLSAPFGGRPESPPVDDELVVRPATGHTLDELITALESAGFAEVVLSDSILGRDTHLLHHVPQPGVDVPQMEAMLAVVRSQGIAKWAEINYLSETAEGKSDSLWVTELDLDRSFPTQYSVDLLGLPAAQARSKGQGVLVAILDTGFDFAHPALAGTWAPGADFVADGAGLADVGDGADGDGDGLVDEGIGHGTFVASLIRLVAPEAALIPLRVLDSEGRADNYRVAKALYHAIDAGADVINVSFGTTYRSAGMEEAVEEAKTNGIVVCASMGNQGVDDPREYPASDSGAFGLAATDINDQIAPFSNFGPKTAFAAPGVTTMSAGNPIIGQSIIGAVPGGAYATWSGTSLSAALATGTVALVRAQHPEWPTAAIPLTQIVDAVNEILASGAIDITQNNPQFDVDEIGDGRLHAGNAALLSPPAPASGDLDGSGFVDGWRHHDPARIVGIVHRMPRGSRLRR